MIDIDCIRAYCQDETIIATKHFADRLNERDIEYKDVLFAIMNGEVIEEYPDAYPYPCALIMSFIIGNRPLHVVAGTDGNFLWLITAYYPALEKWSRDYRTRKVVE